MGYETEIAAMSALGKAKSQAFRMAKGKSIVGGMQAGAYVGIAIILITTLGATVPTEFRPLIMGGTFGLALILVVIAGGELFTGYNLYTAIAVADGQLPVRQAISSNVQVFLSNLLGAFVLVCIYWIGEGALTHGGSTEFIQTVAAKKMHLPATALIARGALCNWLVCLALWMAFRVSSESAKCIVIAWCLLAFIAAGFEHSVANMTVHLLALFGPANEAVTVVGAVHNLLWVTLGNVIGGALFVGLAYWSQTTLPDTSNTKPTDTEKSNPNVQLK